jgi:predicted O-methyltransferase YrrM
VPPLSRFFAPSAYLGKCRQFWHRARYDVQSLRREERAKFKEAGLDRDLAEGILREHLRAMGRSGYDDASGMGSVHWLLFACVAQGPAPRRILEIGTYDGGTTALLARLFPTSEIVTVDLPASDPILRKTYARESGENFERLERELAVNTSAKNITALRVNSFFLPAVVTGPFDVIWVDGGHLYPEIAWDLCNAYHLAAVGGTVMCDDVIIRPDGLRNAYVSPDSHAALRYITERTGDPLWFFLKRESPEWSADPRQRKYVALMRKRG